MAPSHKRKSLPDDDFIHTISDNDEPDIVEEDIDTAPTTASARPSKKAKTASSSSAAAASKKDGKGKNKKNKNKNKKGKKQPDSDEDEGGDDDAEEAETTGLWGGANDADDGAMDSDFEFGGDGVNGGGFDEAEFEGWGFEGAKKGINGAGVNGGAAKSGVDLDEIIRRRRESKKGGEGMEDVVEEEGDDMEVEDVGDVDLDDEVLADDAFGMGAGSDVDEEGEKGRGEDEEMGEEEGSAEEDNEDDEDDAASDNDSVATPVQHPDDDEEGSEDDDEEDAEEEARRKEFFASPEETEKSSGGKKGDMSSFQAMSLSRPILRGLTSVGFTKPTPIQAKTIPIALMGKDVVGGAVTGSGKTAAFVVPILERLLYRPKKVPTTRVVVLTPTRELAIQCHSVATKLAGHTDIKFCLAVGGLSLKVQEAELRLRPDVVIATPGRFIDHMRNSASFAVDTIEILVLDEADRMLEDGFADELNEILTTLPKSRQTMLFSATMTSTVDKLIRVGLNKPARIMVDSQKKTAVTLAQEFVRLRPGREEKRMGYLVHICKTFYHERVIIFFRQKKIAHRTRIIFGLLGLSCAELHGSMNQAQRIASVESFRDGKVNYLLATDLASRGLDIKGVDTVINYEAPQSLEIYVHRVGRTARAGRSGVAVTLAAEPDRKVVKAAVRSGKAQGAKIISRIIDAKDADKWQDQIDEMDDEIDEVLQEEKEEKQLAQVEMQVKKGENLIKHEEEIHARPKRTWFETQDDKKKAKELGRTELNGVREAMKKKGAGRLSNKDKKKLDSKAERSESQSSGWKKGRQERDGKGAVLNLKKVKKPRGKPTNGYDSPQTTTLAPFKPPPAKLPPRPATVGGSRPPVVPPRTLPPRLLPPHLRARLFAHPHPHHRSSLFGYLLPPALRAGYRERLLRLRWDILPRYKRRVQSRIYAFLVERQQQKQQRKRRLAGGLSVASSCSGKPGEGGQDKGVGKSSSAHALDGPRGAGVTTRGRKKMQSQYSGSSGYGYGYGAYGTGVGGGGAGDGGVERGSRRRKLAAVAGSVYRAGVAAASELKEQYNNTRIRGVVDMSSSQVSIPGAFPNVSIVTQGGEQMVLFPTYAKRHVREYDPRGSDGGNAGAHSFQVANAAQMGMTEEEYWKQEWARAEDEKAVVDVDVRGWIYMPSKGPMTRRNRMLIGLARRLSGIPAPTVQSEPSASSLEQYEDVKEEQRIAREAREIEKRGQDEKEIASKGGYSEPPSDSRGSSHTHTPVSSSAPPSPTLPPRTTTMTQSDMTDAELSVANANLMARLGPFMTTPLVQIPITIFFYNNEQSRSHTVTTDDSGHFNTRVALEFVPTNVKVLANENISTVNTVEITESRGVSLISDVDDTIKQSNISMGTREIFRNALVRDLADLTVDGVKEWYNKMYEMGVKVHYCSNSPWQMYPVLATFFHMAGLPQGSMHLKHYSGMLQGIFEPVAERKKGTLEAIIRDFPERRFLLVGDSGEADLEVYTELAVANPGRILAVFIRDVTTTDQAGFFDSSYNIESSQRTRQATPRPRPGTQPSLDDPSRRPQLPPRATAPPANTGPAMGTLIDFDEPPAGSAAHTTESRSSSNQDLWDLNGPPTPDTPSQPRKAPPPRPIKPHALRSSPSMTSLASSKSTPTAVDASLGLPLRPRTSAGTGSPAVHTPTTSTTPRGTPPPPPPPRRRGTAPLGQHQQQPQQASQRPRTSGNLYPADVPEMDPPLPALPGNGYGYSPSLGSGTGTAIPPTAGSGGPPSAAVINKKAELWLRRLERAHELLDRQGVKLYTWRRGEDVIAEAEGIVKEALREGGAGRRK
ncbi:uncharacterized protein C8A04DRAFT_28466 [Dichotomopilus funicola]|uniref:RNA helicase n=1 Tax=Dichotomopilus funicola TaxID=1934379 RepID=A0AAN6V4F1_9PEZI|nr:hypothetical protein C8A04DRAFT_28466 [Dichotomopilus funicola]